MDKAREKKIIEFLRESLPSGCMMWKIETIETIEEKNANNKLKIELKDELKGELKEEQKTNLKANLKSKSDEK